MIPASFVVLHGGSVLEITLLEYVLLSVLHVFAFGSIAVVVLRGMKAVDAVRSGDGGEPDGGENDS